MKLWAITMSGLLFFAMSVRAAELPRTLFEMAGAKPEVGRLSNSVLVIVDAQREYVDGALPLVGVDAAIAETAQLLVRAREFGAPVIHVVHKGKGALFNPASTGFEIVAALQPLVNEIVIEKVRVSSFAGTKLEEAILHTGRKNLIIVGFMTHNCVSSTARAALDLGYKVTIVAGATATRDLPDGNGGVIPAATMQAASLAELADRTGAVVLFERDIQK